MTRGGGGGEKHLICLLVCFLAWPYFSTKHHAYHICPDRSSSRICRLRFVRFLYCYFALKCTSLFTLEYFSKGYWNLRVPILIKVEEIPIHQDQTLQETLRPY